MEGAKLNNSGDVETLEKTDNGRLIQLKQKLTEAQKQLDDLKGEENSVKGEFEKAQKGYENFIKKLSAKKGEIEKIEKELEENDPERLEFFKGLI